MIEIGRKYVVTLKKGVDCLHFEHEMTRDGQCHDCVPDRCVHISNPKPASLRSTEYVLSPDEAELLKKHPDVLAVELDHGVLFKQTNAQQHNFFPRVRNKSNWETNWGLRRVNLEQHEGDFQNSNYDYVLDGTGVDIIIQDNGVYYNHPEFLDFDGNSRFNNIDWYAETGTPGTMPVGHYSFPKYHGTHVAGIAAGLNYGWAKNAQIYSIRFDLMPTGDEFDLIRLWHEQKPVDPVTGVKRPTIVNASWGYSWFWPGSNSNEPDSSITNIHYRGTDNPNATPGPEFKFSDRSDRHPFQYSVIDAACQDMIDAGVIFVAAAGNSAYLHDVPGGQDYNNHYTSSQGWPSSDPIYQAGEPIYYNRPGSPTASNAIITGNIYNETRLGDRPAASSERGPAVNIWAPGSDITSCGSPDANSDFSIMLMGLTTPYRDQTNYSTLTISGTSMAAPQVTGLLALFLQLNPQATQDDCLNFLLEKASRPTVEDSGTDDQTDTSSLLGSAPNMLYNPFAAKDVMKINPTNNEASYSLSVSEPILSELQQTITTITLSTTGLTTGERVPYSIDRIEEFDILEPLTGEFVLDENGESTITITATDDRQDDGKKTGRIRLTNRAAVAYFIIDNSSATLVSSSIVEMTGFDSDGAVIEGTSFGMKLEATGMMGMEWDFQIKWAFIAGPANGADIQPYRQGTNPSYHSFNDIIVPVGVNPYINLSWNVIDEGNDFFNESGEYFVLEIRDNRFGPDNWQHVVYQETHTILQPPTASWIYDIDGGQVDANGHYIQPTNFDVIFSAVDDDGNPAPELAPAGTELWYRSTGQASSGSDFTGFVNTGRIVVNNNNGNITVPVTIQPGNSGELGPETAIIYVWKSSSMSGPPDLQVTFIIAPYGATTV
jgi:subtilisin family serine protease